MPPQRRILLAILILTASACYKPYVFSPPGRVALLETAKTVGDGAHSVGVHGGQSIVDDFRVNHLTARYRYGLSDQLEVGADANLAKYDNMPAPPSRTNPFIGSAQNSIQKAAQPAHNDLFVGIMAWGIPDDDLESLAFMGGFESFRGDERAASSIVQGDLGVDISKDHRPLGWVAPLRRPAR